MRFALLCAASLLVAACNAPVEGDAPTAEDTKPAENDAGGAFAEKSPAATEFAKMVTKTDLYAIAAAKIALNKAQTSEVGDLAKVLIDDHTQSSRALRNAVGQNAGAMDLPSALDQEQKALLDALADRDGLAFDREYLSQQIAANSKFLALLKSYSKTGDDADLRQFAESAIPAAQQTYSWLDENSLPVGGDGSSIDALAAD
ncbi:DUF4142 domain-containing protein [Erythrobacter sp. R86502]|uniref:DUF4142 domain-containing protein n=1 Tax=Erythrobacter sp. R86502 TaxID=3093846 RepID=UPI0036D3F4C1